jgi:hypothetical protein
MTVTPFKRRDERPCSPHELSATLNDAELGDVTRVAKALRRNDDDSPPIACQKTILPVRSTFTRTFRPFRVTLIDFAANPRWTRTTLPRSTRKMGKSERAAGAIMSMQLVFQQ